MQAAICETSEYLVERFQEALVQQRSVLLCVGKKTSAPGSEFAQSVADGLSARPRRLESRFLYDAPGSALFEQICDQPEYYPARAEAEIIRRWAPQIASITGPMTVVELGSGSSTKTGPLLEAYQKAESSVCYVPIDVSSAALSQAADHLRRRGRVQVIGVNSVYADALPLMQLASPLLVLFLGSTVGNLDVKEASAFWVSLAARMRPGDYLLLGVDLVKSPELLNAAYNDAAGVTAAFTRNLFARMNRELGSAIDLDAIKHEARYVGERQQVEIGARFLREQLITLRPLGRQFHIAAGERIETETSRKYRLGQVISTMRRVGFTLRRTYTDERGWFGDLLFQRAA